MKITVMGDGAFGSAIMSLLDENRIEASYWKGEILPKDSIVIGAIPTQAIREVLESSHNISGIIYINCAKGIEKETHKLPYQIVTEILDKPDYFTLIGPSFAEEIKKKMPTLVNLGYRNKANSARIKKLFQTDYFRVKCTCGIRSLELAASFKNIYAISCGITDGLELGMNTRVKIMCLAMEEFNTLRKKLNYKVDGNARPATIGDLILTCNSEESRNFSFGKLLAKYSVTDSLKKIKHTVEGYHTVESIPYFEREAGVKLPLARFVLDITHSSRSSGQAHSSRSSGQAHSSSSRQTHESDFKSVKSSFMNFVKTT